MFTILKGDSHPIRVANAIVMQPPSDGIPTEVTSVSDLTTEAQDLREVLLEVMEQRVQGTASLAVERQCGLLNPRPKVLCTNHFVNDSASIRIHSEEDSMRLIATFEDAPA